MGARLDLRLMSDHMSTLSDVFEAFNRKGCDDAKRIAKDPALRAHVERWIRTALDTCEGMARHVIEREGWEAARTTGQAFQRLAEWNRIDHDLARDLGEFAALRDRLVAGDGWVDEERLAEVADNEVHSVRLFAGLSLVWLIPGADA